MEEACKGLGGALAARPAGAPVVALAFASRFFAGDLAAVASALEARLDGHGVDGGGRVAVAVLSGGVVGGNGYEREDGVTGESATVAASLADAAPSLGVWIGRLPPGSSARGAGFPPDRGTPPRRNRGAWAEALFGGGAEPVDHARGFLVFADTQARWLGRCTAALDAHYPEAVAVGGCAARVDGATPALYLDGVAQAVGSTCVVALAGERLRVDAIASQGCAAVGGVHQVTGVEAGQVLTSLDGARPRAAIDAVRDGATDRERDLMRAQLLVGLRPSAADRLLGRRGRGPARGGDGPSDGPGDGGDWLVRQVIGLVPSIARRMDWGSRMTGIDGSAGALQETDGLAVGADLVEGDELRFHVRDAAAARADLDLQLRRYALERAFAGGASAVGAPAAALVVQCVGRGAALFGESGHDSRVLAKALGPDVALGGLFANGELGPVGAVVGAAEVDSHRKATHHHEYSTVVAVISTVPEAGGADPSP